MKYFSKYSVFVAIYALPWKYSGQKKAAARKFGDSSDSDRGGFVKQGGGKQIFCIYLSVLSFSHL